MIKAIQQWWRERNQPVVCEEHEFRKWYQLLNSYQRRNCIHCGFIEEREIVGGRHPILALGGRK